MLAFLSKVPWKTLAATAPGIIHAAKELYEMINKRFAAGDKEIKTIKLISDMAEQIQLLGDSLKVISARITIALIISITAILLCIGTILWINIH